MGFKAVGTKIMESSGISSDFYEMRDISPRIRLCLRRSDAEFVTVPMEFRDAKKNKWIAMCCFGVNTLKTTMCVVGEFVLMDSLGRLHYIGDDIPFPDISKGRLTTVKDIEPFYSYEKFSNGAELRAKIEKNASCLHWEGGKIKARAPAIMPSLKEKQQEERPGTTATTPLLSWASNLRN